MFLNEKRLKKLIESAKTNENKRSHFLLHNTTDDAIQQIAFCIQPETLIDVHKHKRGTETIVCLEGEMAITFLKDDKLEITVLNKNNPVFSFNPAGWHTYTSLRDDTVGIEIKEGPYSKENFIRHDTLNEEKVRSSLNEQIVKEISEVSRGLS